MRRALLLVVLTSYFVASSLPYWVEDGSSGRYLWVRTNISNNTTLLVYFNGTSSLSNGSATFDVFDDFEGASLSSKWVVGPNAVCSISVAGGVANISSSGDWWRYADTACGMFIEGPSQSFVFESSLKNATPIPSYVRVAMLRKDPSNVSSEFFGVLFDGDGSHITTLWRDASGNPASWAGEDSGSSFTPSTFFLRLVATPSNASWFFSSDGLVFTPLKEKNISYGRWVGISPSLTISYVLSVDWVRVRKALPPINITYGAVETGSWTVGNQTYGKRMLVQITSPYNVDDGQVPLNYSLFDNPNIYVVNGASVPPSISLVSPANSTVIYGPVNLAFNVSDDNSNLTCSLYVNGDVKENISTSPGSSYFSLSPGDGLHRWRVECSDGISSSKSEEWQFIKVTQPPPPDVDVKYYDDDIEELNSKIQALEESIAALNTSIASLREDLNETSGALSVLSEDHSQAYENVSSQISGILLRVAQLESSVKSLKVGLSNLANSNEAPKTQAGLSPKEDVLADKSSKQISTADNEREPLFLAPLLVFLLTTILLVYLYTTPKKKKFKFRKRRE